jgi:hypothetical protein
MATKKKAPAKKKATKTTKAVSAKVTTEAAPAAPEVANVVSN